MNGCNICTQEEAIVDLFARGAITSASMLVHAEAAEEGIRAARRLEASPDIGVHLTFTGQRENVQTELRGQLERAIALGVDPTHADNHQGTLMGLTGENDHLEEVFDLCGEYRLPFLLPRRLAEQPFLTAAQKQRFANRIAAAHDRGILLIDDILSFPYQLLEGETYGSYKTEMIRALRRLAPGVTEIVIHPARYPQTCKRTSHHEKREMEYRVFCDPDVRHTMEEEGLRLISWRDIRDAQRSLVEFPPSVATIGNTDGP